MKGTTFETFQNVAVRYARMMGNRDRVKLTFGGNQAMTDGRHMILPAFEAGTIMSPWQWKVYNGYLDHETAHLRYTDFKVLDVEEKKGTLTPLKKSIWNVLEDIRVENAQIDDFPGSRVYLDALCQEIDDKYKRKPDETQGARLFSLLYKEAYAKYRDIDTGIIPGWLDDHPEYQPIARLMEELPECTSTREVMDLVDQIMDAIPKDVDWGHAELKVEDLIDEDGNMKPIMLVVVGNRPGVTPGDPGPKVAVPGGDDEEEHTGDPKIDLEKYAVIFLSENDKTELLEAFQASVVQDNLDIAELGDRQIKIEHRQKQPQPTDDYWKGTKVFPPADTSHDNIFVPSRVDMRQFDQARATASAEILALKKMLSIYLRSRSQRAWSRGLEEGVLDTDRLASLATGDVRLFKEKRTRQLIDTAVEVLSDNSGSMDEMLTRLATIMLAEALNGIPSLKLSVTGFTTNSWYASVYESGIGRTCGLDLKVYKDYDEPYLKARGRLGAIETTGGTPLGDAYGHAMERILGRKEPRRVLMLVSDGDPSYSIADHEHNDYHLMRRVHAKSKRLGIETIGIMIGGSARLAQFVDKAVQVRSQKDLPERLMEILRETVV